MRLRRSRKLASGLVATAALLAAPEVASAATADAAIGFPQENAASGFGIYNTTGEGQTRKARVRPGKSRVFDVTVENDGTPGRIGMRGCASSDGFKVRYTSITGDNITRRVVEGTYGQRRDTGATLFASVTIKSTKEALVGVTPTDGRKVCKVSGFSADSRDVVKAVLAVKSD